MLSIYSRSCLFPFAPRRSLELAHTVRNWYPRGRICVRGLHGIVLALLVTLVSVSSSSAAWSEAAKLVADDTLPGSWAGWGGKGIDISGNTVILGAAQPNRVGPGEAYVFQLTGSAWMQTAELKAADGEVNETFGKAVEIEGHTAVIAAPGENSLGGNTGAAYVFEFRENAWHQVAKLAASDGAFGDSFGSDVAIFGNTIVVGADHDRDQGHFTGAAYVFQYDGSAWAQTAKLIAGDQAEFDGFGNSVGIDGKTILVGAVDEGNREGAVYVFEYDGSKWSEVDKLTVSDPIGEMGGFGGSLDIRDGRAVIGRNRSDEHGSSSGSAYVFEKTQAGWVETAKLVAHDAAAGDNFGISAALDGDTIVVGAFQDDDVAMSAGAAYIFEFDGTIWSEVSKLTVPTGGNNDLFGYSVAIDAGFAVVSALGDDEAGLNAGAAYVFSSEIPEPTLLSLLIPCTLLINYRRRTVIIESAWAVRCRQAVNNIHDQDD